ncbi:DUF6881 domain-containing protein [Duganella callida]|uniref:DUF6881 domain-containing protein n=1 Tax=Duganella callida TaxID=2561932 RepID=UPI00197AD196|nr:hypothetical protein [Duganella callida]
MNYIDVIWHTTDPANPIRLVSELDEHGFETRKLEFFRDGAVGYADETTSANGCALGELAVAVLAKINEDREFAGVAITAAAFEELWSGRFSGPTMQSTRTR